MAKRVAAIPVEDWGVGFCDTIFPGRECQIQECVVVQQERFSDQMALTTITGFAGSWISRDEKG